MDSGNKRLAFIALILLKVVTRAEVTLNEIQQLENVVEDLGADKLNPNEFRY